MPTHTVAHKQAHTPLHTQLLCPAIVLQRKPTSGGGGRLSSSAEGECGAEGADGEREQRDGKDTTERSRRRKRKMNKEEEARCYFPKISDRH